MELDVLTKLAEAPQALRLKFVLSTIEKNPDNPDAWLNACIRNWKNTEMSKRLLGSASVHTSDRGRASSYSSAIDASRPEATAPRSMAPASFVHGDVAGQVGTRPAEEAIAMRRYWPTDKSSLIQTLADILDEDVQEPFLSLDPEDQCAMSFAFMLTAAHGDTPGSKNLLVKTWLERLGSLQGSDNRVLVKNPSLSAGGTKVHVQLILAGMPSITAGTLVSVLAKVAPTLHRDMDLEFFPHIYVDVVTGENVPINMVADVFHQPFHKGIHTMQEFADELQALPQEWNKVTTKFIFVTNVGLVSTPDENVKDLEANRLDRADLKWIWDFSQAALAVRKHTKDEDVAEIFIGPQAPAFHGPISNLWGEMTTSCAAKHPKLPVAMPQVFPHQLVSLCCPSSRTNL